MGGGGYGPCRVLVRPSISTELPFHGIDTYNLTLGASTHTGHLVAVRSVRTLIGWRSLPPSGPWLLLLYSPPGPWLRAELETSSREGIFPASVIPVKYWPQFSLVDAIPRRACISLLCTTDSGKFGRAHGEG
jgi:hypothetical protein